MLEEVYNTNKHTKQRLCDAVRARVCVCVKRFSTLMDTCLLMLLILTQMALQQPNLAETRLRTVPGGLVLTYFIFLLVDHHHTTHPPARNKLTEYKL